MLVQFSAKKNAKMLEKYHLDCGNTKRGIERNPSSEIYKIWDIVS